MKPVLITGGAGFIGTNLAARFLSEGTPVIIFDNLTRSGAHENLDWLRRTYPAGLQPVLGDVRDRTTLAMAVRQSQAVFHLAAQVAVSASLEDPTTDFGINAGGTLNVLEAARAMERPPPILFTSTGKVYGGLEDVALVDQGRRYAPADARVRDRGVGEWHGLDFHSPYGCSKGAADQYVIDYARSFGLKTVVFRMSSIYGPHQHGNEDQGWVAHFLLRALEGHPVTLYGDGKQVRDLLFVDDLVEAFALALRDVDRLSGQAFNVGGGPSNALSLIELLDLIADVHGQRIPIDFQPWRAGDRRYYVSDAAKLQKATGWSPKVDVRAGVARLYQWLSERRVLQAPAAAEAP